MDKLTMQSTGVLEDIKSVVEWEETMTFLFSAMSAM